jgi:DDE superfamily endonuclease
MISVPDAVSGGDLGALAGFRQELYRCLTARADALFELSDAVLCAEGPVTSLVELSLVAEHRRGHGALYDGLAAGGLDPARLRRSLTGLVLPRAADGRIVLTVDVSAWLRPDAATSPDRLFCHVYGRGKGQAQMIPGWPYSFVAALEPGRSSWTALLDAVRLDPDDDPTLVTAGQVREQVDRLRAAGHWQDGDPDISIVLDAGYDVTRLAFLLADLPVVLLARVRSDRVFRFPAPPRRPGTAGRLARHGPEFALSDPATHPSPEATTVTGTTRYGTARACAWTRLHPLLTHRGAWTGHHGTLPIITGSIIRLTVDRLPGDRHPKPVWLWCSHPDPTPGDVDRLWQAFLRRFDIEHTFRFLKQTLGWTRPRIRTPEAADRWTWVIIAAHTQLRLARHLADDLRRPWEKPVLNPDRLTPARVRRGFRHLRPKTTLPASAPKPSRPGPGHPPGSPNRQRAPRHDVGKNTKTNITKQNHSKQTS